jgi:phosphoribosylglycinamide formyltransferase-1
MEWSLSLKVAVLISGSGSNLQAIWESCHNDPRIQISLVISDQASAFGLTRAKNLGLVSQVFERKAYATKEQHEQAITECLRFHQIDLVVLAGFMRILSPHFIHNFKDRILNVHPSLLPALVGLDTHERALTEGHIHHGASVHVVTADLDAGPLLMQGILTIQPSDTPQTLQQRVHAIEHVIYPKVIKAWANQQIIIKNHKVYWDGELLTQPRQEIFS